MSDEAERELWMPVRGYKGLYEISNLGRVMNAATGKLLASATHRGYHHVALYREPGKAKTVYIHRALLEAFCGPPPFEGAQACHNDGNRGHNRLTNLRWGTSKDNAEDRGRHGRQRFGTGMKRTKLNEQSVREMRAAYRAGRSTYALARDYQLSTHTTWCAVTGKTWKHVEGAINDVG